MSTRAYSSELRSQRAAATRDRILAVAQELLVDTEHDVTLDRVAAEAGVSVQTVIRAFGGRDGLMVAAIGTMREREDGRSIPPATSLRGAVRGLFDDYEEIGDRVLRMLAEEHRVAGFAEVAALGRRMHRAWVEASFGPWLAAVPSRQRRDVVVAVIAATDVYVWKLLRRDLGMTRAHAERIVERLVRGALSGSREE